MSDVAADNPFRAPSELPYGLPPFGAIRLEHYLPALRQGMAEQRSEVAAVAAEVAPASVQNTLVALERSGSLLARVEQVLDNLLSSDIRPELAAVEREALPELAAHRDAILMDQALFARVSAVHAQAPDGEDGRLARRWYLDMQRAGAGLDDAGRDRLRALNTELSVLGSDFRNRLQADTNDLAVHVSDASELDGLPDDAISAAALAAAERGLDGWLITLMLYTCQPASAVLRSRDLRRRLHEASVSRGRRGNEHDTRAVLTRIVALRAERAALLGYPHHAAYVVDDQTAPDVPAVMSTLTALTPPALANAAAERDVLTEMLHADGHSADLQPWDWAYYANRLNAQRFSLDVGGLRPFFELERVVRHGVFAAAGALFGLSFTRRPDLVAYHPDVEVYEVFDETGSGVGLFLADWYARESKRGGAWMNTFVDQSHLLGTRPVVVINLNVPRPPAGSPTLLTLDEVRTAFHEFGHVLHGLLSDVAYRRLSGTNVPRDVVEFPSQVNEMWAWWPDLVRRYAVHHETGEPLSEAWLEAVVTAESAGQAFATTELLAAMLLDQAWHQLPPGEASVAPSEVEDFEAAALARFGVAFPSIPPRYGSSYFAHVFAGGYSAGYYSYLWSEVLDADMVDWFAENGGLQRALGRRFADGLLSRGDSVDAMAGFAAVRGRPPRIEPLLERRGLLPT